MIRAALVWLALGACGCTDAPVPPPYADLSVPDDMGDCSSVVHACTVGVDLPCKTACGTASATCVAGDGGSGHCKP
jgi:hypothetical protein